MVALEPASVVVVPFPFSDLSATKLRPAVVLAPAGHDDWLLCQITSNPYSDPQAIRLTASEMARGGLNATSFARPLKVFTANRALVVKRVGVLKPPAFEAIIDVLLKALQDH